MYDNELSMVMQQEHERAIREARLHHRADLPPLAASKLLRLRLVASSLVRAVARRRVAQEGTTPSATGQPGLSNSTCGPRGSGSSVAPG